MIIDASFFSSLKKRLTSSRHCRILVSTMAVIVLIGAGSLSYVVIDNYIDSRRDDYCLAFSEGDFGAILDGIDSTTEDKYDDRGFVNSSYWTCRINGSNGQRINIRSSSDAQSFFNKSADLTVAEDRSMIPGAVATDVPGSNATVVSWTTKRGASAGWFEGDSAVVISTFKKVEASQLESTAKTLAEVAVRRAPTLLSKTGFTPTHTPTTTPDPSSSPT